MLIEMLNSGLTPITFTCLIDLQKAIEDPNSSFHHRHKGESESQFLVKDDSGQAIATISLRYDIKTKKHLLSYKKIPHQSINALDKGEIQPTVTLTHPQQEKSQTSNEQQIAEHPIIQVLDNGKVEKIVPLPPIKNIGIKGGGVRCFGYGGALEALEAAQLTNDITYVAGSSGGAIASALYGPLGRTASELKQELMAMDFKDFEDQDLVKYQWDFTGGFEKLESLFIGLKNLLSNAHGYYSTHKLREWVAQKFAKKYGNPDLTFGQLQELIDKKQMPGIRNIVVPVTDMTRGLTLFLDATTAPNVPIATAVAASAAFPGFFQAIAVDLDTGQILDEQQQTEYQTKGREFVFLIDGGFLDNDPVEIFNADKYLPTGYKLNSDGSNPCTLNLRIETISDMARINNQVTNYATNPIGSYIGTYGSDLNKALSSMTIDISDCGIGTLDFGMTSTQKQALYNAGLAAGKDYIENFRTGVVYDVLYYHCLKELYQEKSLHELQQEIEVLKEALRQVAHEPKQKQLIELQLHTIQTLLQELLNASYNKSSSENHDFVATALAVAKQKKSEFNNYIYSLLSYCNQFTSKPIAITQQVKITAEPVINENTLISAEEAHKKKIQTLIDKIISAIDNYRKTKEWDSYHRWRGLARAKIFLNALRNDHYKPDEKLVIILGILKLPNAPTLRKVVASAVVEDNFNPSFTEAQNTLTQMLSNKPNFAKSEFKKIDAISDEIATFADRPPWSESNWKLPDYFAPDQSSQQKAHFLGLW